MSTQVRLEREGEIAVIVIDNPPVNAGSLGVRQGLLACIARAAADPEVLGMVLIGATIVANGAVGAWLVWLGKRTGSVALGSDGKHLLTDAITSLAAIGALLAVHATGWKWVDPVVAIGMAAVILVVGYRMVRRSMGELVDEQDPDDYRKVSGILDSHVHGKPGAREPLIRGWHKLRTRHLGRHHWVDFHVQVPGDMDVRRAHDIASHIEHEIEQALGGGREGGNATAHVEPAD